MTGLAWFLAFGCTYRLTLLVTSDRITKRWRDRTTKRGHDIVQIDEGMIWCRCGEDCSENEALDLDAVDAYYAHLARVRSEGWRYLLTCPWCASIYIAPLIAGSGLAWSTGWGWQLAAGALTASGITGAVASYAAPEADD